MLVGSYQFIPTYDLRLTYYLLPITNFSQHLFCLPNKATIAFVEKMLAVIECPQPEFSHEKIENAHHDSYFLYYSLVNLFTWKKSPLHTIFRMPNLTNKTELCDAYNNSYLDKVHGIRDEQLFAPTTLKGNPAIAY